MAAPKRPTHVVVHKSLYLRVEGKLQEMKPGTQLTLSGPQAKKMVQRGMISDLKDAESIDLDNSADQK